MKNKKHIISGLLLSLLIGAQMLVVPVGMAQTAATPAPAVDEFGDAIAPAAPAEDPAAAATRQDEECKKFSKNNPDYGNKELTCAEMKAADEASAAVAAEKLCTDAGYKDCDEYKNALKSTSGQGFKLNLNAFTLTSDGKQQGQAIFNNPNYDVKKYGPIVATLLSVIDILVKLIGSFALLTLITAGIFMIANHGDEAWVTKGKGMMLYSILGILFALLSYALVNVIQSALA